MDGEGRDLGSLASPLLSALAAFEKQCSEQGIRFNESLITSKDKLYEEVRRLNLKPSKHTIRPRTPREHKTTTDIRNTPPPLQVPGETILLSLDGNEDLPSGDVVQHNKPDSVPYDRYEHLREKYENLLRQFNTVQKEKADIRRRYDKQKLQGGTYRKALELTQKKCKEAKDKLSNANTQLRSWQEFADKLVLLAGTEQTKMKNMQTANDVGLDEQHALEEELGPASSLHANSPRSTLLTPRSTSSRALMVSPGSVTLAINSPYAIATHSEQEIVTAGRHTSPKADAVTDRLSRSPQNTISGPILNPAPSRSPQRVINLPDAASPQRTPKNQKLITPRSHATPPHSSGPVYHLSPNGSVKRTYCGNANETEYDNLMQLLQRQRNTPSIGRQDEHVALTREGRASSVTHNDGVMLETSAERHDVPAETTREPQRMTATAHASSQTTEDEQPPRQTQPAPENFRKPEDDDDIPQVVSTRTLKRKRQPDRRSPSRRHGQTQDGGGLYKPIRVKKEHHSSSPIGLAAMALPHNESLDLDEIPGYVETPRKRRLERMLSNSFRQRSGFMHDRSQSEPPAMELMPHQLSDSFEMEIEQYQDRGAQIAEREDARNQDEYRSDLPEYSIADERERELPAVPSLRSPCDHVPSSGQVGKQALHPLSTNARLLPRTSHHTNPQKTTRRRDHPPIDVMAEDGDRYADTPRSRSVSTKSSNQDPNVATRPVGTRIRSLLENPTPNKHDLISSDPPEESDTSSISSRLMAQPEAEPTPYPRQAPNLLKTALLTAKKSSTGTVPSRSSEALRTPVPRSRPLSSHTHADSPYMNTRPEEEPLRAKPPHRLSLEDFRINPSANQGYDYAFSEVVRNLDQRRCLPGCTRPACCGDRFRKMVELGGMTPTVSRSFLGRSEADAADNIDDEQRLLEDFLGDGAAAQIRRMTAEERKEHVIMAQVQQLAQKYGRHRHAFQRGASPPGFWRTDMPTTQEDQEDREAARRLERERVEERWKEAMKPDGRFRFKDEVPARFGRRERYATE